MAELRELIISGLLIGLFLFAIVNFGISLANDNQTNVSILDNEEYNQSFGILKQDLTDSQATAEAQRQAQETDIPSEESESLPLKSAPKIGKAYTGMLKNTYDLTLGLIGKTLGISPVVLAIMTTILLLSITMLIWAWIRSGR